MLPAESGHRFCVFHRARRKADPAGVILFVAPFAEEMNKSRRMVALQARRFADEGYGVLLIDLLGCGDSTGEFVEARWDAWLSDLDRAVRWVAERVDARLFLWGLRLGVPLALDFARGYSGRSIEGMLLWQPVVNGEAFLTQFLRLKVAAEMLSGDSGRESTAALRSKLSAGAVCEVAGYELHPELAARIDKIQLARLEPAVKRVGWIEVVSQAGRTMGPASNRVLDRWKEVGCNVQAAVVVGEPFWATAEISECESLVGASCEMMTRLCAS